MSIDETKLGDEDYFKTAKKMAAQEARKLAQVVAVAVLGEDYYDVTDKGGYLVRKPNETRLARLTSLFLHTVTPSQLLTLAILITNVSNLGDFINSIRLMSATRTSDPTQLIEQPGKKAHTVAGGRFARTSAGRWITFYTGFRGERFRE